MKFRFSIDAVLAWAVFFLIPGSALGDDVKVLQKYMQCFRSLETNFPTGQDRALGLAKSPCGSGAMVFTDNGIFALKIKKGEPYRGTDEGPRTDYVYLRKFLLPNLESTKEQIALVQLAETVSRDPDRGARHVTECAVSVRLIDQKEEPSRIVKTLAGKNTRYDDYLSRLEDYLDVSTPVERLPLDPWADDSRKAFESKILSTLRIFKSNWFDSFQKLKKTYRKNTDREIAGLKKAGEGALAPCNGLPGKFFEISNSVNETRTLIENAKLDFGTPAREYGNKSAGSAD